LLQRLSADLNAEQIELVRKELEKAREEMKRAVQPRNETRRPAEPTYSFPVGPTGRNTVRSSREDERRFGARLERPSETLVEQLGLPRRQGLVVAQVQPESGAGRAGIRSNDILLELGGKPVSSDYREFTRNLEAIDPMTAVDAVVLRKGRLVTIENVSLPAVRPMSPPKTGPSRPGSFPRIPLNISPRGGNGRR
jgi:predicted metalloprotease with PDZ domain